MTDTFENKVDRALELVHQMGLTPADLLVRQKQVATESPPMNENEYNNYIILDSEQVPSTVRTLIEKTAAAEPRLRQAGAQRLWQDFRIFNIRKGKTRIAIKALLGFLRVWEDRLSAKPLSRQTSAPEQAAPVRAASALQLEIVELASPAPARNRAFHREALLALIGASAYQARVTQIIERYACAAFTAGLAVHGMAVAAGEISP